MKINFISSVGTDEFRECIQKVIYIEIMNGSDASNERFKIFLRRYQEGVKKDIKFPSLSTDWKKFE